MKRSMKLLSAILVTTVMAGVLAIPVSAAGTTYTGITGPNATFDKYLLVNDDTNAPDLSFNYTVSAAPTVTPAAGQLPVYTTTDLPTVAAVTFASSDTAEATTLATNFNTYKKTATVDFTGVTFTEPGVYRYYIDETETAIAGVVYDIDPTTPETTDGDWATNGSGYRTLDVYVEDNTTATAKTLKVTSFVMYDGHITGAPADSNNATSGSALTTTTSVQAPADPQANVVTGATKTDRYVNFFDTYTITIGKEVTGNQGSKDKYFEFTLSLTSPVAGTFTVDTTNADDTVPSNNATLAAYVGKTNNAPLTVEANTAKDFKFYLQDGQYITISGIPGGTKYTLTEEKEDYTSTNGITAALSTLNWDGTTGYDALDDALSNTTGINANVHTGFTNDKQGIIPTGIILKMAPVAGIAFIVVAGVIFFGVMSVKRKEYEDSESEAAE